MRWTTLSFGKHQGKTLPQIAFSDPDYLQWAAKEGVFTTGALAAEFKEIVRKAQTILIPGNSDGDKMVRYYVDTTLGKLGNIEVIESDRGPHHGSSAAMDRKYFDLLFASKLASYDKTGGRFVVDAIKYHVFGKARARITKERAESFFSDAANFA